jgi:type VI secretion system protein
MPAQRLLERIIAIESGKPADSQDNFNAMLESISIHLNKLLNTGQGSVLQAPDYGAPDLNLLMQSAGGETITNLEENLAQIISRYEPRLTNVKVIYQHKSSPMLMMNFRINASMLRNEGPVPVFFETQIAPDGHIEVHKDL